MSQRTIIPHICYLGENNNRPPFMPASWQYFIYFEYLRPKPPKKGKNKILQYGLAITDRKGRLHRLSGSQFSFNQIQGLGFIFKDLRITNFKTAGDVARAHRSFYRRPLEFFVPPNQDPKWIRGFCFLPLPVRKFRPQMLHPPAPKDCVLKRSDILRYKMAKRWEIPPKGRIGSGQKVWFGVRCVWEDYYYRMMADVKRLSARIKAFAKRMRRHAGCIQLVEEMNKTVWRNAIGHKSNSSGQYACIEPRLIRNEVINPLRKRIRGDMRHTLKAARGQTNAIADRIIRSLTNPNHHKAFEIKFKLPLGQKYVQSPDAKRTIDKDYRRGYCHAYCLVSRTDRARLLCAQHVWPFLYHFNPAAANPKQALKKAVDDFSKKAGWFKALGGEIIAVAQAYATAGVLRGGHADGIHRAMAFLNSRGLVASWSEFDTEMKTIKGVLAGRGGRVTAGKVMAEKYIGRSLGRTAFGVKALNGSLHALKMVSILTTDYSKATAAQTAGNVNAVMQMSVDIANVPRVQKALGGLAAPFKVGGRITTVADWAISLYSLSADDWKKDGYGFSSSMVSCAGKAFATAGLFVAPPAGLVLVAIGGALELVAGIIDFTGTPPSSVDLSRYNAIKKKLFQVAPGYDSYYRQLTEHATKTVGTGRRRTSVPNYVSSTRTYRKIRAAASGRRPLALDRRLFAAVRTEYKVGSSGDSKLKLSDLINQYLAKNAFGVRTPIANRSEWQKIRVLMLPT